MEKGLTKFMKKYLHLSAAYRICEHTYIYGNIAVRVLDFLLVWKSLLTVLVVVTTQMNKEEEEKEDLHEIKVCVDNLNFILRIQPLCMDSDLNPTK